MRLDEMLSWIQDPDLPREMLVAIFTFGNIFLAVVLSVFCWILKPVKILFNTIGAISAGALLATFINLFFLIILLIINVNNEIMLYSGFFISLSCYAFCLHNADRLWKIGKASEKKNV